MKLKWLLCAGAVVAAMLLVQLSHAQKRPSIFDDEPVSPKVGDATRHGAPETIPSAETKEVEPRGRRIDRGSRAWAAHVVYEAELKQAEAEFRDKARLAKATYGNSMQRALASAMSAGDLDESLAIQKLIKANQAEAPESPARGHGLIIEKAIWAFQDKFVDVTPMIRAKVQADVMMDIFNTSPHMEDVGPYKNKMLTIRGSYGGKEFYLSLHESSWDDGGVWFGKAPPPNTEKYFSTDP